VELNNFSPHAYMTLTGTILQDRIPLVSGKYYAADYWDNV
jgi:hypothetical protein